MVDGWRFFDDVRDFLEVADGFLAADPLELTVMSAWATREARRRDAGEWVPPTFDAWYAVHAAGEVVVAVAMRTAPFDPQPLWVPRMSEDAARSLGRLMVERGEVVPGGTYGVNGAAPSAAQCAEEIARGAGGRIHVTEHTRLFRCDEVLLPARPAGALRPADAGDHELINRWLTRFHTEADEQAGREPGPEAAQLLSPEEVRLRIADGKFWLYEVDGRPVHLSGAGAGAFGVARIGPVYTPPAERGQGYAGWVVASLTRQLLDQGLLPCLNTDQANPVSNRVYEAIGYTRVSDHVQLRIA